MELVRRILRYAMGVALIGVVLATAVGIYAVTALNRPVGAPGPPVAFSIDSGERVSHIAARLEDSI